MTHAGSHYCQTGDSSPHTASNFYNKRWWILVALSRNLKCFVLTIRVYKGGFAFNLGSFYREWVYYIVIYALSSSGSLGLGGHEFVKMQHSETCPNLIDKSRFNYSVRWSSSRILFISRWDCSLLLGNNRFRRSGNELGSSRFTSVQLCLLIESLPIASLVS